MSRLRAWFPLRKVLAIAALALLGVLLLYTVGKMPPMNRNDTPDKTHVVPEYLEGTVSEASRGASSGANAFAPGPEEEGGARNVITSIILNYRGYDTMGEVTVIFSALCAVVALLDREKRKRSRSGVDASGVPSSVIVRTVVRFAVPVIIFFAVYVLLHGESSPGGGFQGGAVIGASVILFAVVFGLPESTDRIGLGARTPFESIAMFGFLAMGFVGIAFGANFLTYLLPGLSEHVAVAVRTNMLNVIEVGIGVAGGIIFTSIVFMMIREDVHELQPDSP